MSREHNSRKFIKHLKSGGLIYAFWRGIKYFIYLIRKPLRVKNKKSLAQQKTGKSHLISCVIANGDIKAIYSGCGINIFWKEKELTMSPGLNIAVNTLGMWTDSSKAKWQILLQDPDFFDLKVVYNDLPLSQLWHVKLGNNNEITWRIRIQVEEWLHIDEFRLLALISSYYKVWISNYSYADFPRLDNYWHDINLKDRNVSLVGARFSRGDNCLPSFTIESHVGNLLPLVQNPPLGNYAHIIGLRIKDMKNKNNFEPGIYPLFDGKVNIIENEDILDAKIEVMRQNYLANVVRKDGQNNEGVKK